MEEYLNLKVSDETLRNWKMSFLALLLDEQFKHDAAEALDRFLDKQNGATTFSYKDDGVHLVLNVLYDALLEWLVEDLE